MFTLILGTEQHRESYHRGALIPHCNRASTQISWWIFSTSITYVDSYRSLYSAKYIYFLQSRKVFAFPACTICSDLCGGLIYRVRHKSVNTPLSHERLVGGLQDGGRGTHVTHFVQLYPQPLYTASQVRTTCRSWDEGVLTDLRLTGVLTDLCLTLYIKILFYDPRSWIILNVLIIRRNQ